MLMRALLLLLAGCAAVAGAPGAEVPSDVSVDHFQAACRELADAGPRQLEQALAQATGGTHPELLNCVVSALRIANGVAVEQEEARATANGVVVERRLSEATVNGSTFFDTLANEDHFYLGWVSLVVAVLFIAVFSQEICTWRTTLFPRSTKLASSCKARLGRQAAEVVNEVGKRCSGWDPDQEIAKPSKAKEKPPQPMSHREVGDFWKVLGEFVVRAFKTTEDPAGGLRLAHQLLPTADVIQFARRDFSGLEAKGIAKVTVNREGSVGGPVTVRIRTGHDKSAGGFAATENIDFVPVDKELQFAQGEMSKSFDVTLLPTDGTWSPTRWLRVELVEVLAGDAMLGGPTVAQADESTSVRVYILQDDRFPPYIPEEKFQSPDKDYWLLIYYFKERIKARKSNFWKTVAGLCYAAFHDTVVTAIVYKFLMDWASDPDAGGSYANILILAGVQLFSSLLFRWGDIEQTGHRGRTGGCRQFHRAQLMSKMLMMEYREHHKFAGSNWFYSALMNVDVMAKDAYWQLFVTIQSCVGMVLCIAVLIWKAWYSGSTSTHRNLEHAFSAIFLVAEGPAAFAMVFGRRKEMANRLVHRMEGEESWVDVFAWLSQHGRSMFALSVRDLVRVEKTFLGANKFFCKWHVSARDYLNDSTWITKWLSHGSYVIVLSIAFVKLYQSRSGFGESFTTGDAVLLIQLYKQFHKYLVKLATSYVTMLKGAVSIGRVADLLRLPEQRSLAEKAAKEFEGGEISENTPVDHNHIVLKGVAFRLPEHGLGYMSDFTQADGEPISIPLGKVVYVTGATEGERYAFVALIAKLVLPEQGTVSVPSSVWSILLPFVPVQMPCGTIKEDFEANGCTPEAAENLAKVLGLEPGMAHDRMNPGQAVKEAIVRAMLRDPTILICMAPLQCVSREHKQALFTLMLAWQIGGGGKTLMDLMERELVLDKPLLDQIGEEGVQRRTLILSGEKPPDWIRPDMVHIVDLDRCAKSVGWGPAPPEVGAVAQEEALVIETQAVVRSA